jgi:hypothetical protein
MKRKSQLQNRLVALAEFRNITRVIREDAERAGLDKMTMQEIDAEVDATHEEMLAKSRRPVKPSLGK